MDNIKLAKPRIQILLINSYDFDIILENWKNKINPSHFLMGKIELEKSREFVVDILQHEKFPLLNKIGNFFKVPYLDQQLRVILSMSRYDVLYFPYPFSNTRLIMLLKFLGVIRKPIVVLGHQNFPLFGNGMNFLNKMLLVGFKQFEFIAFFSTRLREKTINLLYVDPLVADKKCISVSWGADCIFYKNFLKTNFPSTNANIVVCAGTVDRDFDMVIKAFDGIPGNLKIFCTPNNFSSEVSLPENITVDNSWISYSDLLKVYSQASFLIIPIKENVKNRGNTFGLTVLMDAIALGIPVLMTYHPYIDLDIEAENIGMWVKNNTIEGWNLKFREMFDAKDQYATMRANALTLHKTRLNADIFASEMADIFRKAVKS